MWMWLTILDYDKFSLFTSSLTVNVFLLFVTLDINKNLYKEYLGC